MATNPLTGARLGDMNDAPDGGLYLAEAVNELSPFTLTRFASTAARDTAWSSWSTQNSGKSIPNGACSWCDSPGQFYDRIGGVWVPRPLLFTNPTSLDGTTVPAGAKQVWVHQTFTTAISNAGGGFNVNLGVTFTKMISCALTAGDNVGSLGFVVPIVAQHTNSTAGGVAFQANGAVIPQGTTVRIEVMATGYI